MHDSSTDTQVSLEIASQFSEARRVQDEIEKTLQAHQFDDAAIFAIKLAVEEAIINAIKHGNQLDTSKKVLVEYFVTSDRFEITIRDQGEGFNPEDIPDPTDPSNLERPCGRGLLIIRKFMSKVDYLEKGNVIVMTKSRKSEPA